MRLQRRGGERIRTLDRAFYDRDATVVARELLGTVLVHRIGGQRVAAKIVETEAYMGALDKAAHSYGGKKTDRVKVMYGPPGHAYIFMIYGMHYCFNVVVQQQGIAQAVLLRALEPVEGLEVMAQNRFQKPCHGLTKAQIRGLTNGPGKLCRALSIDKGAYGADLCAGELFIEAGEAGERYDIVPSKRIGIEYAEEAREFLWRFYIKDNPYVSVP